MLSASNNSKKPQSSPKYAVPQWIRPVKRLLPGEYDAFDKTKSMSTESYILKALGCLVHDNATGIKVEHFIEGEQLDQFRKLAPLPQRIKKIVDSPEFRQYVEHEFPEMSKEDIDLIIEMMHSGLDVDKSGAVNPALIDPEYTEHDLVSDALCGINGFPMLALIAVYMVCGVDLKRHSFADVVSKCVMVRSKEAVVCSRGSPTGGLHDDSDVRRRPLRDKLFAEFREIHDMPTDHTTRETAFFDPDFQAQICQDEPPTTGVVTESTPTPTQLFVVAGKNYATKTGHEDDRRFTLSGNPTPMVVQGMVDSSNPTTRNLAQMGEKKKKHFTKANEYVSTENMSYINQHCQFWHAGKDLLVWAATNPGGGPLDRGLHGASPAVQFKNGLYVRKVFPAAVKEEVDYRQGTVNSTIVLPRVHSKQVDEMLCRAVYTWQVNGTGCHTVDTDIEAAKSLGVSMTKPGVSMFTKEEGGYGALFPGRFPAKVKTFIKYTRYADGTKDGTNKGFRWDVPQKMKDYFSQTTDHGRRRILAVNTYFHRGKEGLSEICDGTIHVGSPASNPLAYGFTQDEGEMFCRSLAKAILPFPPAVIDRLRREEAKYGSGVNGNCAMSSVHEDGMPTLCEAEQPSSKRQRTGTDIDDAIVIH